MKTERYRGAHGKRAGASRTSAPRAALFRIAVFAVALCCIGCTSRSEEADSSYPEYRRGEFTRLEALRDKKVEKVLHWLNGQKRLIEDDETISKLTAYYLAVKSTLVDTLDRDEFLRTNNEIERFFIYELGSFYDLLFIDKKGVVFYSVKMEDDFQTSFVHGPLADTQLAGIIKEKPGSVRFVDFEYYGASDEPAAFYVLPIKRDNRHYGWIALQLSINQLNKLLTERSGLGRTGEAYLVNNQQLMLTESRFINESTVLSKNIDTEAVRNRTGSSGNKIIIDYRGVKVLSTFRTFRAGGASWRILVEKDEDEVVTDYYRLRDKELFPFLVKEIANQTEEKLGKSGNFTPVVKSARRVDVGELARTDKRKKLFTMGLATCTGVIAYAQNNDFAYMAHLSPMDDCYRRPKTATALLGDRRTDLISLMMRRIRFFDIKPSQITELNFIVAAPHDRGVQRIIGKLMDAGVSLSQIKVSILPRAASVSLVCDMNKNSITGQWRTNAPGAMEGADLNEMSPLDSFIKKM